MTQEAGTPPGFWERVEQIAEKAAARQARSAPLRNATISGGSLTVKGGKFRVLYPEALGSTLSVYVGDMYTPDLTDYLGTGLLIQSPDGTDMAMFRHDDQFNGPRWDLYDSGQRVIAGNDASSGFGLARPYLPAAFYRRRYADMTIQTTSPTFETLFEAQIHRQHPRLEVGARATNDTSGSTGEVRVLVNGVVLGTAWATSFVITPFVFGPDLVTGNHMQSLTVEIQARLVSGTGSVKVEPQYLVGRQSP